MTTIILTRARADDIKFKRAGRAENENTRKRDTAACDDDDGYDNGGVGKLNFTGKTLKIVSFYSFRNL